MIPSHLHRSSLLSLDKTQSQTGQKHFSFPMIMVGGESIGHQIRQFISGILFIQVQNRLPVNLVFLSPCESASDFSVRFCQRSALSDSYTPLDQSSATNYRTTPIHINLGIHKYFFNKLVFNLFGGRFCARLPQFAIQLRTLIKTKHTNKKIICEYQTKKI